jgi:hypothetical protein
MKLNKMNGIEASDVIENLVNGILASVSEPSPIG